MTSTTDDDAAVLKLIFHRTQYPKTQWFLGITTCWNKIAGPWGDVHLLVRTAEGSQRYYFDAKKPHIVVDTKDPTIINDSLDDPQYAVFEIPLSPKKLERLQDFLKAHSQDHRAKYHLQGEWNVYCCMCHTEEVTKPMVVNPIKVALESDDILNEPHQWIAPEFVLAALMYLDPDWSRQHWDALHNPYETSVTMLFKVCEEFFHIYRSNLPVIPVPHMHSFTDYQPDGPTD